MVTVKYRKTIGGYVLDSIFGVNKQQVQPNEPTSCRHCGKKEVFANCQALMCRKPLCGDCAKKCKSCGKYFCPKHIGNHKCNLPQNSNFFTKNFQ